MQDDSQELQRIRTLERSLMRLQITTTASIVMLLLLLTGAFVRGQNSDEVRTRRLVVVDDHGQTRVVLGQDRVGFQRSSRAAGLLLYDEKGNERGGFSTMADGSVVIGMDAPVGVGAAMRDRIGLKVYPNGSSQVMLIDNQTGVVARMISEEGPGGSRGVQVFKWEPDLSKHYIRTVTFDGDVRDSVTH